MTYRYDSARLTMTEPRDPAERIRERMRRWMDTTQLDQRTFAEDLGKSQVWLQKVLSGENSVRLKDLDRLAEAMRTTASELVRSNEERYQLELSPTEVRVIEQLRRAPDTYRAITILLKIPAPVSMKKGRTDAANDV
jgi:transcriptional regulator with XRE-family HTH domain